METNGLKALHKAWFPGGVYVAGGVGWLAIRIVHSLKLQ